MRLLSLLQSASMLTQGMQRASEWGIAGGIGYNRQPARLIHSRIYERLRIRPGEPSRDVRGRPLTSGASGADRDVFSASADIGTAFSWGYFWGYRVLAL